MSSMQGRVATWLGGVCVALLLLLSAGVLALLLRAGMAPFWPAAIVQIETRDAQGSVLWLGRIVEESRDGVVLHLGDDQEAGRYRRLDADQIIARDEPVAAAWLRSPDGKQRYRSDNIDSSVVDRVQQPNAMGLIEKGSIMFASFAAFVSQGPEHGGVLPALIGTVTLVLLMSVLVMPVGIAAAIWLSEYAGNRRRAQWVRGAISSLAGVPTIVYGVLGVGLFVHAVGGGVDRWLYADRLPAPTFGSGGLLWAALTLAMLTLPVVVVSIEEGLARIPRALRDASLALGATRSETLWQLLLPIARPALLTAFILAIARAAGAVAPLMLVGVVKFAPSLPIDGEFPYLHPSRQFMHLGFAIYDQAFASTDAYAGIAQAWSCALLLVLVVLLLNGTAIVMRRRLSRQHRQFDQEFSA